MNPITQCMPLVPTEYILWLRWEKKTRMRPCNQKSDWDPVTSSLQISDVIYSISHGYMVIGLKLVVGWAMVLGSFQCLGVLLLLHIVGKGPAVLAAGAWRVGYIFYIFHLSSLSNVLSFGRRLNMTEILWFRLLNPNGSCQLLPMTSSLGTA